MLHEYKVEQLNCIDHVSRGSEHVNESLSSHGLLVIFLALLQTFQFEEIMLYYIVNKQNRYNHAWRRKSPAHIGYFMGNGSAFTCIVKEPQI